MFGLFGTCPFAGGIIGTALAVREISVDASSFHLVDFIFDRFILKEQRVGVSFISNRRSTAYASISMMV